MEMKRHSGTSVNDVLVHQPLSSGCCSRFVDPFGLKPVIVRDDTEFDLGTYDIPDAPFEA
jgi:hypothetical protein